MLYCIFSGSSDECEFKDIEYVPGEWQQKRERSRHKSETMTLQDVRKKDLLKATTPTATRFKLTPTQHLAMVSSTVSAAGGDMNEVIASLATTRMHRRQTQIAEAEAVKARLKSNMPTYKVIHWDGKLIEFLNVNGGGVYQDANAVILSSPLELKPMFLGSPAIESGTGQLLCDATVRLLGEWDVLQNIIATCWDTTAANTGVHEGAASHFERFLGYAVLWLACRHHMAELHIKHTYDKIQGATQGM